MNGIQAQAGNCPNCGHAIRPYNRFCMNCAYDLLQSASATAPTVAWQTQSAPLQLCHQCGAGLGAGAVFCGNCGASIAAKSGSRRFLFIGGISFIVLALAGAAVWFFFLRSAGLNISFAEKLLATVPDDQTDRGIRISFDGTRAAYIASSKDAPDKKFVVADGKSGKEYEEIRRLTFSLDGSQLGYIAKDEGKAALLVVNGKETKLDYDFDEIEELAFNPSGNAPTLLVRRDGKSFIVVNNKKRESQHDTIEGFAYTVDGRLLSFARNKETKAVVADDKVILEEKEIRFHGGQDGRTFALVGITKKGDEYAVVDGKKTDLYDRIKDIVFSADGSRVFVIARKNQKDYLIRDGKAEPLPKEWEDKDIAVVSYDGKTIAHTITEGGKTRVVVTDAKGNDKRGEPYERVSAIALSSDGSKVAYIAGDGEKSFVVAGEQKSEAFDEIYPLPFDRISFNSNGTKVAFAAIRKTESGKEIWWKVMDAR
ncbi:MAG TPA: zinc-ribbon domain-containing protein [Blastocatellia bacterium]|nr:zinc-ribbon domain-containing protein [Blastocatellia bacterium]